MSKDTLDALVQTSDFFFEQIGEDLAAYAQHGGRKVIEESDVIALMKRYAYITGFARILLHVLTVRFRTRQLTNNNTVFSLAQTFLPRELLQQLRMPPLPKMKSRKRKQRESVREEENEDD